MLRYYSSHYIYLLIYYIILIKHTLIMSNKRSDLANIDIESSPPSKKKQKITNTSNINDNNINNDNNGSQQQTDWQIIMNHTCTL